MSKNTLRSLDKQIRYWLKDIKPKPKQDENKLKFKKPNRR